MTRSPMGQGLAITVALLLGPVAAVAQSIADVIALVSQDRIETHIAAIEGRRQTVQQFASASSYVRAQLESFGYSVTSQPVIGRENLITELTGVTDPNSVFIIGAHLDTVGTPGADDNASGIAGMLEAARVLRAGKYEASIQFMSFAFEETGRAGSSQVAGGYAAAGVNVTGMVSLEMIAYTCPQPCQFPLVDAGSCLDVVHEGVTSGDYIGAVANSASAGLVQGFLDAAQSHVPSLATNSAIVAADGRCFFDTRRSDHASFWDVGYPAMMITDTANWRNPHYHLPSDTLETLDLTFAANVTRAVVGHAADHARYVPEPAAPGSLISGLLGLGALARRR